MRKEILISSVSAFLFIVALSVVIFFIMTRTEDVKPREKYDELEFVVVHRPHITYFVDFKYMLCWATLKPTYQDLKDFTCTERLLNEASGATYLDDNKSKKDAGKD